MTECKRSTLRACSSAALTCMPNSKPLNRGQGTCIPCQATARHSCVQRWHFACPAQTQVSASNLQCATEALCVPCSNSNKCKRTTQPRTQVRAGSALHCYSSGCCSLAKCNCNRSTSASMQQVCNKLQQHITSHRGCMHAGLPLHAPVTKQPIYVSTATATSTTLWRRCEPSYAAASQLPTTQQPLQFNRAHHFQYRLPLYCFLPWRSLSCCAPELPLARLVFSRRLHKFILPSSHLCYQEGFHKQ